MPQFVSDDASVASSKMDSSSTGPSDTALASKETKRVLRLRWLVFGALFMASAIISVVVYRVTTRSARSDFETLFLGSADKILQSFESIVSSKVAALTTVGVALTSAGNAQVQAGERGWPFVTINDFQQRCSAVRSLSGFLNIQFSALVSEEDRLEWEAYSLDNLDWVKEGADYQESIGVNKLLPGAYDVFTPVPPPANKSEFHVVDMGFGALGAGSHIFALDFTDFSWVYDETPGPYVVTWQSSPVIPAAAINYNMYGYPLFTAAIDRLLETGSVTMTGFNVGEPGSAEWTINPLTRFYSSLLSIAGGDGFVSYNGDPMSYIFLPVFDSFEADRRVVGVLNGVLHWATYFANILPSNSRGLVIVLENSCFGAFTFQVDGAEVSLLGEGDLHDTAYDDLVQSAELINDNFTIADGTQWGLSLELDECAVSIRVYPSKIMQDDTSVPLILTSGVAAIFLFTVALFIFYDRLVESRQHLVMTQAVESTAVVSSLFPEGFRERVIANKSGNKTNHGRSASFKSATHRISTFLKDGSEEDSFDDEPIADLFPHTTVMFADLANFTAWSSTRDPTQVFILLQAIYQSFDVIAKKRKVFKVETIGDCYVAVAGLPNPQPTHAVIMARFAAQCSKKVRKVVRKLEVRLGPDTGDLGMRFGLHSGPVTAGVLRGERARFQLFGDTVNTTARIEATGHPNKIHASSATATLLRNAGKGHWVTERIDKVVAKGKGELDTFWIDTREGDVKLNNQETHSVSDENELSQASLDYDEGNVDAEAKQGRLVDWMTELLLEHLKRVVAREGSGKEGPVLNRDILKTNLDEVVEIIQLPRFNMKAVQQSAREVVIPTEVVAQLRQYVSGVAGYYRANPFHNFEHACHVTMSVDKLLKRIVAPAIDMEHKSDNVCVESQLHEFTHGITSDPLTHLAIVFSALIHDTDHRGVGNGQLCKEDPGMAKAYRGKSVAEQNSLDLAWNSLMSKEFDSLRSYLFANDSQIARFRQIVVNTVLATDIFDKELNDLRKNRWNAAFVDKDDHCKKNHSLSTRTNGLRATIVMEHIIQASDVCHTMQHWHVYRKWNKRLFAELYQAFKEGRMGAHPSTFWYQGELGFFDNYIIPLAKKLKECNVFGVSSDEYLNYAEMNRAEWEKRGKAIVEEMMDEIILEEKEKKVQWMI